MFNPNFLQWWGVKGGEVESCSARGGGKWYLRVEEIFHWHPFLIHCKPCLLLLRLWSLGLAVVRARQGAAFHCPSPREGHDPWLLEGFSGLGAVCACCVPLGHQRALLTCMLASLWPCLGTWEQYSIPPDSILPFFNNYFLMPLLPS